jgi:translation initiation factor 1
MTATGEKPFHNPFGALQGKLGELPAGPTPKAERMPKALGPARAVVRLQRKGHGGKQMTAIEQLGLPVAQLETWLHDLKKALGCGGSVEADVLVLQGDQRERLPTLLGARGVRKVVVG